MDPHLIRKRQETILETYSFDYEKRKKENKKRTGRVPARLACVLLLLLISVFAAGCSKTGTVYADPSETRTQGPGAAETGTAGRGGQPKGKTGMEALGTALKEESPESAPDESSDRSPDPAAGQSRTEEQTAETQAEGAQQAETQAEEAQEAETQTEEAQQAQVPAEERQDSGEKITEITFTAVGDNLINEVLYEQAAQRAKNAGEDREYDFAPCYAGIAPFIREHDVNWIDIETLMTDTLEPSGYPAFSTPGDSGRALIDAGWNVFSLCSNHTYDQGAEGIRQTLAFWKTMQEKTGQAGGICCTGLWENGSEDDIPILTCKGRKLAFLTYTYGTNDIQTPSDSPAHVIYLEEEELMAHQIELAREQADAVIVSLHWGEEYNHEETEDQQALAQRVADMGADLIIGGHPHVVEGAQMLTAADGRKVFCAYSLGNFLCAQNAMPDPDAMIGLLLSCTFRFTEEGMTVEDHALIPILSDYGEGYADDHVVLYSDYSQEEALAHGMRTMYGFTEFDYGYVRDMLTAVVGEEYLKLP